jgi:predicted transcriptional regulator
VNDHERQIRKKILEYLQKKEKYFTATEIADQTDVSIIECYPVLLRMHDEDLVESELNVVSSWIITQKGREWLEQNKGE